MEEKIKELYKEIELGVNSNCENCKCKNELFKPDGMWHCGNDAENGIMFVGKTAITNEDEGWKMMDFSKTFEDLYKPNYSAFWHYIKAISKEVYKNENEWEKISITNLIKCNKGDTPDSSTSNMIEACCKKNKFLLKEIEFIKPNYIVFMVNKYYKEAIKEMFKENIINEQVEIDYLINNKRTMPVWYFKIHTNKDIDCLLVGHPQGKKKSKYVELVSKFILNKKEFFNIMEKRIYY